MTKERMFYIAYRICDYMRNREMQNQFEEHEFCMYVSDLAHDIEDCIKNNDSSVLGQYYEVLLDELDNVSDLEDIKEIGELVGLLDECTE